MTHEINENGDLVIKAGPKDREAIRGMLKDGKPPCQHEADCLESLIANSELAWIPEGATCDLTGAPMLGILGEEGTEHTVFLENHGLIPTGNDGYWPTFVPILKRWAYMNYQVRSFVTDLLETGECVFQGGYEKEAA
jgi:hypothetical protein